jgi:hypothetical protein
MSIALVQHRNVDAASGASASLAYTSNPAVNNLLVVAVRTGLGTSLTSLTIADTIGNTWTQAAQVTVLGDFVLAVWYAVNKSTAANTVTISVAPNTTIRLAIYEYSGTATSSPLDTQNSGSNSSGSNTPASTSITPAGNNELIFAASCVNTGKTFTAGTNFTLEDQVPIGTAGKLGVEDWIQTTATATTGPFTLSASDVWGAIVAAFKPAGAAGVTVSATGNAIASAAGTVSKPNTLTTTSLTITATTGTTTETGTASIVSSGNAIASAAGTVSETGTARVLPSGQTVSAAVGGVVVSTGSTAIVNATGNAITSVVGAATESGTAVIGATGNALTSGAHSVSVSATAVVVASANPITGSIGVPAVAGNAVITTSGSLMTGSAGSTSEAGTATVIAAGNALIGVVGTVTVTGTVATGAKGIVFFYVM